MENLIRQTQAMTLNLPNKKFAIIYADPPWFYARNMSGKEGVYDHNAEMHYPTMQTEDIAKMPVGDIADDTCLLFMWATGLRIPDALIVGKAWGFTYITMAFIWEKVNPVAGSYTMSSCEYVLVFKKGKIPQPRGIRNARQFLQQKKTRHSAKPLDIKQRIHDMFPTQDKIELFARSSEAPDSTWTHWGNEIAKPKPEVNPMQYFSAAEDGLPILLDYSE